MFYGETVGEQITAEKAIETNLKGVLEGKLIEDSGEFFVQSTHSDISLDTVMYIVKQRF